VYRYYLLSTAKLSLVYNNIALRNYNVISQERLEQITDELKAVNNRREELDLDQSSKEDPAIQHQLETLKNRQAQLLVEQNDLQQNK